MVTYQHGETEMCGSASGCLEKTTEKQSASLCALLLFICSQVGSHLTCRGAGGLRLVTAFEPSYPPLLLRWTEVDELDRGQKTTDVDQS